MDRKGLLPAIQGQMGQPFGECQRVAKKNPYCSPIPLSWTGFRPISIGMTKN